MICRLCLSNSEEYLEFFNEAGLCLKLPSIISKYFWFEPMENDPISNIICNKCWISVENFHKFYTSIELAHYNLKFPEVVEDNKDSILKILKIEYNYKNSNDSDVILKDNTNNSDCIELSTDADLESSHILNQLPDPLGNVEKQKNINIQIIKKQKQNITSMRKKSIRKNKIDNIKNEKSENIKTPNLNGLAETDQDKQISSFMKLVCDQCEEEFPKYLLLKKHVRLNHNSTGYATCCNKKFYKRIFLLEHINIHLNPDYFRCQECNKSFGSRRSFENHNLTQHQTNETKTFQCDICPRKYFRKYLLDQHYKLTHTDIEKNWICDICDKGFVTKNRMITHKNYLHKNAYSKICDICAKVCRSKTLFDKHMLEHKGTIQPKIQCELCEAWLKNPLSLKKHMIRHKEENIQHSCNICGKFAASKFALKNHLRYVHTEAIYKCTVCEKSFKKPIRLKEHMSTHTGEILYTCTLCPKTFNSNANMWSHKKKAHRDQWETDRKNRKAPPENDLKMNMTNLVTNN